MSKNQDPSRSHGNSRTRATKAAMLLAPLMLAAACSNPGDSRAETPSTPSTTETTSTTTTTINPELARRTEASAYVDSPERTMRMAQTAQTNGEKVVALAESGAIGKFKFYNTQNDKWGRKSNPGWGYLQHFRKDGHVMATVYQNADGTFDLSRGVLSVEVQPFGSDVSFEVTNDGQFEDEPLVLADGWGANLTEYVAPGEYAFTRSNTGEDFSRTAAELQAIDELVVTGMANSFAEL